MRALCSGMFISGDSLQCQQQLALFISERNGLMEATGMFRALVEGDANTRFFQTRASVRLRLSTRGWRRRGARTPVCRAEDGSSDFIVGTSRHFGRTWAMMDLEFVRPVSLCVIWQRYRWIRAEPRDCRGSDSVLFAHSVQRCLLAVIINR